MTVCTIQCIFTVKVLVGIHYKILSALWVFNWAHNSGSAQGCYQEGFV